MLVSGDMFEQEPTAGTIVVAIILCLYFYAVIRHGMSK